MKEYVLKVSEILEGSITPSSGGHIVCIVRFVMRRDELKNFLSVKVLKVIEDSGDILFTGTVQSIMRPAYLYQEWEATITAYSFSALLDLRPRTHTYQGQSICDIINECIRQYQGDCIVDQKIVDLPKDCYLQCGETDWSFLKRLLGWHDVSIWADIKADKLKLVISPLKTPWLPKDFPQTCYFYNGICYLTDVLKRGHRAVRRSGVMETSFDAASAAYGGGAFGPAGWTVIGCPGMSSGGFSALILKRNNSIIIAFRGSGGLIDDPFDWAYNFYMSSGQRILAWGCVNAILFMYPDADIYLTGHSLGGHLASEASLYIASRNRDNQLKRVESFNGYGPRSEFDTPENRAKIRGKFYSREFRGDAVSELGNPQLGDRKLYDDGKRDREMKALERSLVPIYIKGLMPFDPVGLMGTVFTQTTGELVIAGKYAGVNHSLDKFAPYMLFHPHPPVWENRTVYPPPSVRLRGEVIEVSDAGFKAKFEEDRIKVTGETAFLFKKSAGRIGIYMMMMPKVGDTVLVEFRLSPFRLRQVFTDATYVGIERKLTK